jgi:hypothetical protein
LGTASPAQFSFVNLATALGLEGDALDEMFWQKMCELRVAVPAVVVSFDAAGTQTAVVQPAVQENILLNGVPTPTSLPQLSNVAVALPRAGGFSLTFPIAAGDECLVVFADMCYDAWWQSGGTANNQAERRRHDLTDGIAIFGIWSQQRLLADYSTDSVQLRSDDGTTVVGVEEGEVTMTPDGGVTQIVATAGAIQLTAVTVTVDGDLVVTGGLDVSDPIIGHDDAVISGIAYVAHEHSGVTTGSGTSGPPV